MWQGKDSFNTIIFKHINKQNECYFFRYWIWHGKFFHAHKFHGLENIPKKGPAVIVYFHGAVPLDNGILISTMLVERDIIIR